MAYIFRLLNTSTYSNTPINKYFIQKKENFHSNSFFIKKIAKFAVSKLSELQTKNNVTMKRVLNYLLLSLSLIVCFGSCKQGNQNLKEEKIDMPKLKKMLANSIFRYEEPKDDGSKHFNCIQIMPFFDTQQGANNNITNQKEYIRISRIGNEAKLEGYNEWFKEFEKRDTYDVILAEICFIAFDEANSQMKVVGHLEVKDNGIGSPMHKFWGNDIVWIKYNPTKDMLEVKLKTPLTGDKGTEAVIYKLKRVKNDISETWY